MARRTQASSMLPVLERLLDLIGHLCGFDEQHPVHIFETFDEGWGPGAVANHATLGDYDKRVKTTLGHYEAWGQRGG